jgi:DNA-binding transcriptional regulator YiaG
MRAFREDADLTQKVVARRMFVSPRTVRDWEAGRRHPTVLILDAYLRVVGGSITLGVRP